MITIDIKKLKTKLLYKYQNNTQVIKELCGKYIVGESEDTDVEYWKESIGKFYESDLLSGEEKNNTLLRIIGVYHNYLKEHYSDSINEHNFILEYEDGDLKIKHYKK